MRSICSKCSYLLICDALHKDSTVECEDFKSNIITNADRIRSMTDEELTKGIHEFMCGWCPKPTSECIGKCEECLLEWLKQEAK